MVNQQCHLLAGSPLFCKVIHKRKFRVVEI
jgi:hypothetical protein